MQIYANANVKVSVNKCIKVVGCEWKKNLNVKKEPGNAMDADILDVIIRSK